MKSASRFLYIWGPFGLYCILIFTLSSFSRIPAAEGVSDTYLHFLEYVIFTVLLWRAIGNGRFPILGWKMIGIVFLIGSIFGALEEIYQSTVPGRNPSVHDWASDVAGILSMITLMMVRKRRKSRKGEA